MSCEVSGRPGASQLASIQVVPTPLAHRIPPRTVVHLFFHDLYRHSESRSRVLYATAGSEHALQRQEFVPAVPETPQERSAREATGRPTSGGEELGSLEIPDEMLRYRLLFWGEVLGVTYTKSGTSRAVVLQCAGGSNYWDMVAADRKGGQLFGGSSRKAAASGLASAPFWDILGGDTGLVFEKLKEPPAMFPNLRGFSAGVLHLFEGLVGVHFRNTRDGTKIVGENLFMAMAELRLRLLQQIGVTNGDDSPLRLLRRAGFGGIWRRSLRGLPRYFTYRQLLEAIGQYTFYEATPVLAPRYTPPTGTYANYSGWHGFSSGILRNSTEWAWIPALADTMISVVDSFLFGEMADIRALVEEEEVVETSAYAELPGRIRLALGRIAENADSIVQGVTESRQKVVSYRYEGGDQSRGYDIRGTGEERTFERGQELSADEFVYIRGAGSPQYLEAEGFVPVRARRPEAIRRLEPVATKAKGIIRRCGELLRLVDRTSLPARPDLQLEAGLVEIASMASDIGAYVMPPPGRSDADSDSEPAHLYADILRPDVWFVPPPRSNVIFPDHTMQVENTRVFVKEPTRLMVRMSDKWLGSDPFFDHWWIAPVMPGLYGNKPIARSGGRSRVRRDILEHELMGGIVPMFHTMSDREMYLGGRISGYGGKNQQAAGAEHKSYFQQVTNFLLFRSRFGARSMSALLRFNPYVVLGFPAVLIDMPTDEATTAVNQHLLTLAEEALMRANVADEAGKVVLELIGGRTGVHYLGLLADVSHMATATGEDSMTRVTFTHAREHNERIEYMGQDLVRLSEDAASRMRERTVTRKSARQRRVLREALVSADVIGGEAAYSSASAQANFDPRWFDPELRRVAGEIPENLTYDATGRSAKAVALGVAQDVRGQPGENTVVIQPSRYIETAVFALDDPRPREGTHPSDLVEPTDEEMAAYVPGDRGPHGGEIVSAVDVTGEYRNRMRSRNVSGEDAGEISRLQEANRRFRDRRDLCQQRIDNPDVSWMPQEGVDDDPERVAYYDRLIADRQQSIDRYENGWLEEPLTLPFLGSPEDNRGRPVTKITSDQVGVPVSIANYPELVGIIGTDDPRAVGSIILRVFRVREDMGVDLSDPSDFGAEDILRPPWYSSYWLNSLVGGAVYIPLFGVGSIVDPMVVTHPEGADLFTPGSGSRETLGLVTNWLRRRADRPEQEEGSPIVSGILEGATIENAIDFLVHTYSLTLQAEYDADAFIRNYTWRPIASMFDMFGSGDLVLDESGQQVVAGVEGFHSRAFGPYSNLFGLVPLSDVSSILGVGEQDVQAAQRLDVRGRRYALISAYRAELLRLRGASFG